MIGQGYVAIGRVGRPHGVGGEVRVDTLGGLPRGLRGYSRFFLGRDGEIRPVEVEEHRPHGRFVLVKFRGWDVPETARGLTGSILYVERSEMPPLDEDEYYHVDALGCRVVDEADTDLGIVVDVFSSAGHDVMVIQAGKGEWMLPVVEEFVLSMDLGGRRIVTRATEGLRE